MAFSSSDGKQFTNRPPMRHHERSLMSKKSQAGGAGMSERTDPLTQPTEGDDEQDGASVAAEHGPASEVHIQHDHEGGMHSVHSMHPDGHEHHSEHASSGDAHEHGKELAGGGEEEQEPEDGDGGDEAEYE